MKFIFGVVLCLWTGCLNSTPSILKGEDLNRPSTEKFTVGGLLAYHKNNIPYLLLARERIDHQSSKAGQWSDLGGSGEADGSTILENLTREIHEESAGFYRFKTEQLKHIPVLYKKSPKGRNIYYGLITLGTQQYISGTNLTKYRYRKLKNPLTPSTFLEKDLYLWIDLKDLSRVFQKTKSSFVIVKGITRRFYLSELRPFFVEDLLNHPNLKVIIQ